MKDDLTKKIYLYMTRRDKKGMKVLATFRGQAIQPTRVSSVQALGLSKDLSSKISLAIHEDRLLWEPWIEAADSFNDLRNSLKKRGYKTPRRSSTQFPVAGIVESNVRGIDKVVTPSNVKTNRNPTRNTMLGG